MLPIVIIPPYTLNNYTFTTKAQKNHGFVSVLIMSHIQQVDNENDLNVAWYIAAVTYFMPELQYAFIFSSSASKRHDTLSKLIFAICIFAPGSSFASLCFIKTHLHYLTINYNGKVQYLRSILFCMWRLP